MGQIKQAEGTIKGKREAEIPDKAHTNNGHQPDTHSNNGKKPEDKGNNGHHVNHGKKCREGKHKGQQPQGEISDASAASASAAASGVQITSNLFLLCFTLTEVGVFS